MSDRKIGDRRGRVSDAAEKWLRENDPEYKATHRTWHTPSTDALARDFDTHETLKDLSQIEPRSQGNYRRRAANAEASEGFEYSDVEGSAE